MGNSNVTYIFNLYKKIYFNLFLQCCKPHQENLKANEINTEKKNSKNILITDTDNFDDMKQFKFSNLNLISKSNLLKTYQKTDNSDTLETKKFEKEKSKKISETISQINKVRKKAGTLNIEVISSSYEPKGLLLKISPLGYENSKRKIKDGITYFGYEENEELKKANIDYEIKPKEEKIDDRFIGQHFQIKFNPTDLKYYLKDLGHGFGTFIKIFSWEEIRNNFLISIGENYIVFTLGLEEDMLTNEQVSNKDDEEYKNLINIKIFSGNIRHGRFSFNPKQSPFVIGRSQECEVIIDDNMLSRYHCTVEYKDGKWQIIDGVIGGEGGVKKSTNGTWKYAFEDNLITNGMTFKANHNLFICSFEGE